MGLGLWFSSPGQRRRHATAATEAAQRTLESGEDDREVLLRAATLLLVYAHVPRRRAIASTFDRVKARERLAGHMPLVAAVEGLLLEEEVIYPVFSDDAPGPGLD